MFFPYSLCFAFCFITMLGLMVPFVLGIHQFSQDLSRMAARVKVICVSKGFPFTPLFTAVPGEDMLVVIVVEMLVFVNVVLIRHRFRVVKLVHEVIQYNLRIHSLANETVYLVAFLFRYCSDAPGCSSLYSLIEIPCACPVPSDVSSILNTCRKNCFNAVNSFVTSLNKIKRLQHDSFRTKTIHFNIWQRYKCKSLMKF